MKTKPTGVISRELMGALTKQFELNLTGIHGPPHWGRVRTNGLLLAELTGANVKVVELFSVLHDSRRIDEGRDEGHGQRACEYAKTLNGDLFELAPSELDLLCDACAGHSDGKLTADITIQVCWDADRLDLGRLGIVPEADKLCTEAARDPEFLWSAYKRSQQSMLG